MRNFELEQDKAIKDFIKKNKKPLKEDLFNFFYDYFLHPDLETKFTHRVAKNIIEVSYQYYLALSDKKKFHFLRALGKLFDIALSMKLWEFHLSRDDAARFWRGLPTYFLSLTHLTGSLEALRQEIGIVDKRRLHSKIVCVEGEAEFNFIKTLHSVTGLANFDFPIYNYQGKGELRNLVHFIKEKNRQGIRVFVSYDQDRQPDRFVKKLKKKCKVERVFEFERDFESSFPPKLLDFALKDYAKRYVKSGKIKSDIKDIQELLKQDRPFIKSFEQKYNLKISKVKLSSILAKIMAGIVRRYWSEIFNKKTRKKSFNAEIFDFLRFLIS